MEEFQNNYHQSAVPSKTLSGCIPHINGAPPRGITMMFVYYWKLVCISLIDNVISGSLRIDKDLFLRTINPNENIGTECRKVGPCAVVWLTTISNSLTIHEQNTKEISTEAYFGYLILIAIEFPQL